MSKKAMRILTLVWAFAVVAMASSTVTLLLAGRTAGSRWVTQEQYDTIERYDRLEKVRTALTDRYYMEPDDDQLMLGAVRGMTAAVKDPYTVYYTPEDLKRYNENQNGAYHGIGVLIQCTDEGYIQVVRVYPGTSAEAAGLQERDLITAVDGESISGADGRALNNAAIRLSGADGTAVRLTVWRDGRKLELEARRGDVSVDFANWQMLDGDIGYLSVMQFSGNASARFAEALEDFRAKGAKGMIIDLRNNPGGLLDQAVAMADRILPKGVIVYTQERSGARQDFYSDEEYYDIPLVVLVNGNSASASEILAAAVQCFDRGTVMGTTTYGKGVVQTLMTFPSDGAGLQLTTACYYDGSGRSIHGTGVTPDVAVPFEGDWLPRDPDPAADNQLAAAIEALRAKIDGRE